MSNTADNKVTKYGMTLGWISIFGNILLFVLKYLAGVMSGSVALIADAWHTLGDSISSVVLIVGIRIAKKPPDEEHPFGHGRAEWISSMLIGVFLIVVGINFIRESVSHLRLHDKFNYGLIAWVATILSILIKETMARLSFRGAKKTGLQSLKADGWHHRTDSLSSVIVLVGLIIGNKFWWIDGVLGILVSLLIFVAAYEILKDNISNMLGKKPSQETLDKIHLIIENNCQKEVNLHSIRIHYYGQYKEMTAHIMLPGVMSLTTAHNIANKIEEMIEKDLGIQTTIHTEPSE